MHKKATTLKGQKLQSANNISFIDWKFNQVISSSVQISIPNIKALA